jgi:hypothetical protein
MNNNRYAKQIGGILNAVIHQRNGKRDTPTDREYQGSQNQIAGPIQQSSVDHEIAEAPNKCMPNEIAVVFIECERQSTIATQQYKRGFMAGHETAGKQQNRKTGAATETVP